MIYDANKNKYAGMGCKQRCKQIEKEIEIASHAKHANIKKSKKKPIAHFHKLNHIGLEQPKITHSFACSALLASLVRSAALIRSLARPLPSSWGSI